MKTLFDRIITVTVFLVSIIIASCIVGLMSRGDHVNTPWWILAALGLSAALMSIGACAWGSKYDNHG